MIKAMPWQTFNLQAREDPILKSHRHNRLWWFQIHNFEISQMTKLSIVKCATHCAVAKVQATEILIPVGNCNSHIGTPVGVFGDAHSGHGFRTHNAEKMANMSLGTCVVVKQMQSNPIYNTEDEKILEFAMANGLCVGNTWFKKRDTHLITYSSSGNSTQMDYTLDRKSFSSAVSNVKVIPNEECVKQHRMVVCEFTAHIALLTLHPNLQAQGPAIANQFQSAFKIKTMNAAAAVATAAGADVDSANFVVSTWSKLKGSLLDAVSEVCGLSKNHLWKSETWW